MKNETTQTRKAAATTTDRLTQKLLGWAPLLAFLFVALPLPLYFLWLRLTATQEPGAYILLAIVSLVGGSIAGFIIAMLLLLYRARRQKKRRDQLAADGITAAELAWFMPELMSAERKTLKRLERQNLLLADAYRETLALRLTATRVLTRAKRELVEVEKRRRQLADNNAATEAKADLQKELQGDGDRLEAMRQATQKREAEINLRLQAIEALAARSASEAETEIALARLDAARGTVPLALEAAKLEQDSRQQAQQELRRESD